MLLLATLVSAHGMCVYDRGGHPVRSVVRITPGPTKNTQYHLQSVQNVMHHPFPGRGHPHSDKRRVSVQLFFKWLPGGKSASEPPFCVIGASLARPHRPAAMLGTVAKINRLLDHPTVCLRVHRHCPALREQVRPASKSLKNRLRLYPKASQTRR